MANVDLTIEHTDKVGQLRAHMMEVAAEWKDTVYLWGGNSPQGIDCSHFVYQVLNGARERAAADGKFSVQLLDYRDTASIEASGHFVSVTQPVKGDLVLWDGHVGIVTDPATGRFIGAQSSTGVAEASYASGYWSKRANRRFLRFYYFL